MALDSTVALMSPAVDEARLERELHDVGRRLAAAMPSGLRNPLKALDDKAMDLASADSELEAALFRFVDVVPGLPQPRRPGPPPDRVPRRGRGRRRRSPSP